MTSKLGSLLQSVPPQFRVPSVSRLTPSVARVLGVNPQTMTLGGSNTYLVGKNGVFGSSAPIINAEHTSETINTGGEGLEVANTNSMTTFYGISPLRDAEDAPTRDPKFQKETLRPAQEEAKNNQREKRRSQPSAPVLMLVDTGEGKPLYTPLINYAMAATKRRSEKNVGTRSDISADGTSATPTKKGGGSGKPSLPQVPPSPPLLLGGIFLTHWHHDHVGGVCDVLLDVPNTQMIESAVVAVGQKDPKPAGNTQIDDDASPLLEGSIPFAIFKKDGVVMPNGRLHELLSRQLTLKVKHRLALINRILKGKVEEKESGNGDGGGGGVPHSARRRVVLFDIRRQNSTGASGIIVDDHHHDYNQEDVWQFLSKHLLFPETHAVAIMTPSAHGDVGSCGALFDLPFGGGQHVQRVSSNDNSIERGKEEREPSKSALSTLQFKDGLPVFLWNDSSDFGCCPHILRFELSVDSLEAERNYLDKLTVPPIIDPLSLTASTYSAANRVVGAHQSECAREKKEESQSSLAFGGSSRFVRNSNSGGYGSLASGCAQPKSKLGLVELGTDYIFVIEEVKYSSIAAGIDRSTLKETSTPSDNATKEVTTVRQLGYFEFGHESSAVPEWEQNTVSVLTSPGHTDDHTLLYLHEERSLATADTVLGSFSTLPSPANPKPAPITTAFTCYSDYMKTLQGISSESVNMKLTTPLPPPPSSSVSSSSDATVVAAASSNVIPFKIDFILPGHGTVIPEHAEKRVDYYISHRNKREEQVIACLKKWKESEDKGGNHSTTRSPSLITGETSELVLRELYSATSAAGIVDTVYNGVIPAGSQLVTAAQNNVLHILRKLYLQKRVHVTAKDQKLVTDFLSEDDYPRQLYELAESEAPSEEAILRSEVFATLGGADESPPAIPHPEASSRSGNSSEGANEEGSSSVSSAERYSTELVWSVV